MKFSYRLIILLALCLTIAAVCVIWFTAHNQKYVTREIDSSGIYQTPKSQKGNFHSEETHQSGVVQQVLRNQTTGKSIKLVGIKTTFHTFNILDEVDEEASMLAKGEPLPAGDVKTDGETAFRPEKLKVIVVPHSHNDPGWLKTIDNYYEDQTKFILNNMVKKLLTYPKMTFIWAESVYLSMWWKDLDPKSRNAVRKLIDRRQLEIVGGGWVVTDEANCHYSAIVDQMIEGHRWLRENIGCTPKNSWSLDPFGYSSLHAYLYKRIGYENAVILRVNKNVKSKLQRNKALEFNWRQVWDRNNKTDFFTLMMPYMLYNIKHSCGPDKEICVKFDYRQIPGEQSESKAIPVDLGNIDRQAKMLLDQYQKKAKLYRHGVVLVPLGDDFRYDRIQEWDQQFKNYMLLFNYINKQENWNVEMRFGIVQDYFDEVAKVVAESGKSRDDFFPSLSGDFFPYTDQNDEYWTGYFTTRPFSKMLSRELEIFLRSAEILNTLCSGRNSETTGKKYDREEAFLQLDIARKNLALFQHHDGITGTSTVWVMQDYESRLYQGLHLASSVISTTLSFLLSKATRSMTPIAVRVLDPLYSRTLMSVQVVRLNDDRVKLIVLNSIARKRQELVQILVDREELEVINNEGLVVTSQMTTTTFKDENSVGYRYVLSFLVELPALGIVTLDLVTTESPRSHHISTVTKLTDFYRANDLIVMENKLFQVNISATRGQLVSLGFTHGKTKLKAYLKFLFYSSRRSGAYIFAPYVPASEKNFTTPRSISIVKGPIFSELRIEHSCVTQILRLTNSSGPLGYALEVNNVVDMTSSDYDEHELVMRLDSSVKSKDIFYTDQNGYHMMKRRRHTNLLLEANYYPSSSVVYVEDDRVRMSVITAQPVGVSSLKQGSVEVMLDRRLKYDDNRGIGAGVMDNKVTLSRFYILSEEISDVSSDDQEFISAPSLLANVLIDSLRNYPIVATTNRRGNLPTIDLMNFPMPCDTLLVNLKTFNSSSDRVGLILHKQVSSAKFQLPSVAFGCNEAGTGIVIPQLFPSFRVQKVYESSLSFLYQKGEIPLKQAVSLEPMELYAYEITFN